jgi:Xaa-Pro aminopeptidase
MVLAIEPGCYMDGGGGLRLEDNFLIAGDGAEKLSPFPDGIVRAGA